MSKMRLAQPFLFRAFAALLACTFSAHAAVTVTAATGGNTIPADNAKNGGNGQFVVLTGPVLDEGSAGEIDSGTIILNAPAGFEFNTAATVTVTATSNGGATTFMSNSLTPTATTITCTVTAPGGFGPFDNSTITFSNIQVRPINGTSPLSSGNITKTGTTTYTTTVNNPSYGLLTEVTGAASKISIVASTNNQTAVVNSILPTAPCVLVQDQFNNAVSNVAVTFAAVTGSIVSAGQENQVTNASGLATLVGSWRIGTAVGANSLTATSGGLANSPLTFSATGTVGPAALFTIAAGDNQTAVVFNDVATPPCVRVTDSFNNPIANVLVNFVVASGGGSIIKPNPLKTDVTGIAVITSWTLGQTAGTNTLTASTTGLASLTFTATGIAGAASQFVITAATNTPGAKVDDTITAQLADQYGNAVTVPANTTGNFTVTNGGVLNPNGGTSDGQGRIVTTLTPSQVAGTTHKIDVSGGGFLGTLTVTTVAAAAENITVAAGDNQTATAGTAVAIAPCVFIKDLYGNPVAGTQVTFAVASGGGSVTNATPTSNSSGIAVLGSWILGTGVGTNTLTASVTGLTNSPLTFTATGVVGPVSIITLSPAPSSIVANGVSTSQITATVTDSNSNPISAASVVFSTTLGVIGTPATTNGSGVATVTLTSGTVAGSATVSAVSGAITKTGTVNLIAGPATQIVAGTGNNQSATVGTLVPVAPAVIVKDINGNPVSGVSVTFAVASGGGSITGPTISTDAQGIAAVGSWTLGTVAGANTLSATSGSLTGSPVTLTATGTAGPATQIAIAAGDAQTATAGSAVATQPCVIVKDANNNPVSGVNVAFSVGTGGGTITGAAATTNAAGIAVVGSWTLGTTAGANTLIANSAGLTGNPVTFTATGIAGAAAKYVVTAANPAPVAGVANLLNAQLSDINGNAVSTANVTVNWTATNSGVLAAPSSVTNAQGIAQVNLTPATLSGISYTITASDANFTGSLTILTVAGPAKTLALQAAALVSGVATDITVKAQDQFNNTAAGYSGTVHFTSSDSLAVLPADYTFKATDNGVKVFAGGATLKTQGAQSLTATDTTTGSITGTLSATVAPPPANAGFTSEPTGSAAQALPGTAFTFTAATPPGVTISWNFGDGTQDNTNTPTVTHTFATAGSYTITVTATDTKGVQVSKTLTVIVAASTAELDTDGDGFADDVELALGSSITDSTSRPFGATANVTPGSLNITKVALKLAFSTTGKDSVQLTGTVQTPAGFVTAGQNVAVDFGGVVKSFVMDKTGKAKSGTSTFKVTIKKGAQTGTFTTKLAGSLASTLAASGFTGAKTVKSELHPVFVQFLFGGGVFNSTRTIVYTAKQGKTGTGK